MAGASDGVAAPAEPQPPTTPERHTLVVLMADSGGGVRPYCSCGWAGRPMSTSDNAAWLQGRHAAACLP